MPTKTTPKTASKKVALQTPKKSPLAGMTVEAYVAKKVTGWQAKTVIALAALVRKAAPESLVAIKWGQPVFDHHGPFAYIRAAKNHVTFGFWRGTDIPDPKGILEGAGTRMMHLKISEPGTVDAKILTPMIRAATGLNEKNGDPTKRTPAR